LKKERAGRRKQLAYHHKQQKRYRVRTLSAGKLLSKEREKVKFTLVFEVDGNQINRK